MIYHMMILFIVLNKYNDIWVVAKLSTTQSKVANEKNVFITITIMIAESNPREKDIMVHLMMNILQERN